jgi:formiminoglutamase
VDTFSRPNDPRLVRFVSFGPASQSDLRPGRPVLIGFPQDEGVHRNGGRTGAALAPERIRHWLYRQTPTDPVHGGDLATLGLLDAGDVRLGGSLDDMQEALGTVVGAVLAAGAIPIVLGGGHETAYGHFLGWHQAGRPVAIVNVDAHLDVRSPLNGLGHSGSPFRQALEYAHGDQPAPAYVCVGAQPYSVSQDHWQWLRERGGSVSWAPEVDGRLLETFDGLRGRFRSEKRSVWVSIDADVVRAADVPGVSAPNPTGLSGIEVARLAYAAGASPEVGSFELVEINPHFDRDDQSIRWGAVVLWNFLSGLAARRTSSR